MGRYEAVWEARSRATWVALCGTSAVVLWLVVVWPLCFPAWPLVWLVAWGWRCAIQGRQWRTTVGDGQISWDPLFRRQRRTIAIADITRIELEPNSDGDADRLVYLRLTSGRRRLCRMYIGDLDRFIAAVVAEKPAIEVRKSAHDLGEALARGYKTFSGWLGFKT